MKIALSRPNYPGTLVVFCGVDGSGKTSLIRSVKKFVEKKGVRCHVTRMPTKRILGYSPVRDFLYHPDSSVRDKIDYLAFSLYLMADRLQVLRGEILPRLYAGELVLCDRYVFQGVAGATARGKEVELLTRIAATFPRPDLLLTMTVSSETAISRIRARPNEKDRRIDEDVLRRLNQTLSKLSRANGGILIPTDGTVKEAFDLAESQLLRVLDEHLARSGGSKRNSVGSRKPQA